MSDFGEAFKSLYLVLVITDPKTFDTVLGATVLGERGLPAEQIGEKIATQIICEIESGATLDVHAFDQILPYMAVARGNGQSSCIVRAISSHAQTNMWLIRQFFENQNMFCVENKEDLQIIKVKGSGH